MSETMTQTHPRDVSPCQRCGVVRSARKDRPAYCADCRPWAERDGWIENRRSWKLTADDKATIRARAADGEPRADLASEYGVTVHTIGRIVTGRW